MEVKFSCDKCDYKGIQKVTVQQHVVGIQEGEHFPCHQCEYTGVHKTNLRQHVVSVHEG